MPSGSADPTILYGELAIAAVFGLSTLVLATRSRMKKMNVLGVWGILSLTFREAIRTKWLIMFAVIFFLLAADFPVKFLSYLNALPPGFLASEISGMLPSTIMLIPLLALPIGATSIVDDRESGTMQYVLSNPITKSDFFLGRIAGLLLATTAVILVGFGAAAIVVYGYNAAQFDAIMILTGTATLLNAVMLALALIISEVSKRKATALGIAVFVWFLLAIVSGLDTLTYVVYWHTNAAAAMSLILLDPIETSRIATVLAANLDKTTLLGQSGFLALHVVGGNLLAVAIGSVLTWLIFLTIVGFLVFRQQDAT